MNNGDIHCANPNINPFQALKKKKTILSFNIREDCKIDFELFGRNTTRSHSYKNLIVPYFNSMDKFYEVQLSIRVIRLTFIGNVGKIYSFSFIHEFKQTMNYLQYVQI